MEWLATFGSPFVCGGEISTASILQFLWIVSDAFQPMDDAARDTFIECLLTTIDFNEALDGINQYIERTFLDAGEGTPSIPFYSQSAALIFEMSEKPYRWSIEKVMKTPLRILYQLIKAKDRNNGIVVVNSRSHAVRGKWLKELNEKIQEDAKPKKKGKPNGK